jgi:hypothetical protein
VRKGTVMYVQYGIARCLGRIFAAWASLLYISFDRSREVLLCLVVIGGYFWRL